MGKEFVPPDFFIVGLNGFEVCLQRSLGVHDDLLAARETNDQVGTEPSIAGSDGRLLQEVAEGEHACHLDNTTQLNLTPASAHVRSAKSLHELSGFRLQLNLCADQGFHLVGERSVGLGAILFQRANLLIDLAERIRDGSNEGLDSLLTLFQFSGCLLLELRQGLLR